MDTYVHTLRKRNSVDDLVVLWGHSSAPGYYLIRFIGLRDDLIVEVFAQHLITDNSAETMPKRCHAMTPLLLTLYLPRSASNDFQINCRGLKIYAG